MGKGEIARYEQFLLFPQCFQKACFPGASKGVIVWEWVKAVEINSCYLNAFPNTSFRDRLKFKETADDNWNVAIKKIKIQIALKTSWKLLILS